MLKIAYTIIFGLAVSLTTLSASLYYKVYFSKEKFDSPLVVVLIAFFMMWLGASLLFIVIS